MPIQWKEGDIGIVPIDSFNNIHLKCCFVDSFSRIVYFISEATQNNYKYINNKLYVYNKGASSWDTFYEGELSKQSKEEYRWQGRM